MLLPAIKVMLVDDSAIIRKLFAFGLEKDESIKVIAKAENGRVAIDIAKEHQPDVIILDIEMPEMDGITAIPLLLAASPHAQIIMASTLTQKNAAIGLKALELGAVDYIGKPSAAHTEEFYHDLREKIKALGGRKIYSVKVAAAPNATTPKIAIQKTIISKPKALAIASSTGGPQAVINVFKAMKGHRFLHQSCRSAERCLTLISATISSDQPAQNVLQECWGSASADSPRSPRK
jgi:two-component system chemotaxis response regulator CheB